MIENTVYVAKITVIDPDTKLPVEMEIRKIVDSDAMIGIDMSFLEKWNGDDIRNPYSDDYLNITEDDEDKLQNEDGDFVEGCRYCGGNCPRDADNCCDGYSGNIDNLYE
jgi:hypothetical protein